MSALRNTYGALTRIIWLLLAVHFFNLSIDSRDREPDFAKEDLSINDIESISEYLTEIVFGFDDIFAEHDEADGHGESIDFNKILFSSQGLYAVMSVNYKTISLKYFIQNTGNFSIRAREITSPPPKA
jgi:hypothetical protein